MDQFRIVWHIISFYDEPAGTFTFKVCHVLVQMLLNFSFYPFRKFRTFS